MSANKELDTIQREGRSARQPATRDAYIAITYEQGTQRTWVTGPYLTHDEAEQSTQCFVGVVTIKHVTYAIE